MTDRSKTIIAIATPPGVGAIGIIRVSGSESRKGINEIFSKTLVVPRRLEYGFIRAGEIVDEVTAVYFENGKSYTGEESVEIYCHGSQAILRGIVDYAVKNLGFEYAEGGDFTARAYINGKLDLTEAEGVYDIINAETEAEIKGAFSLLSGGLKRKIEDVQEKITTARAVIEAPLDYPEEDVEEETTEEVRERIKDIKNDLEELIKGYGSGRLIRDGVKVAVVGKPNAGKSSLMNALLGYDRAIVTDEKGTTRDTLTESYQYKGVRFVITDTAGIRRAESEPEKIGVERAIAAVKEADVVVVLIDCNDESGDEVDFINNIKSETKSKIIIVENKTDLSDKKIADSLGISAKTGFGVEELKERIFAACGLVLGGGATINNARQAACVVKAKEAILRAEEGCETTLDVVSGELYEAFAALGRITGITGSDSLADEIFKKFCVGK